MVLPVEMENLDVMVIPVMPEDQVLTVNPECKESKENLVSLVKAVSLVVMGQKVRMALKDILEDVVIVASKVEMDKREEMDHPVSVDLLDHQVHQDRMFESSSVLLKTWFTSFVTNYYKL